MSQMWHSTGGFFEDAFGGKSSIYMYAWSSSLPLTFVTNFQSNYDLVAQPRGKWISVFPLQLQF